MTLRPWAWAGLAICGSGVVALTGFAFVDLGRADQIASVTGGCVGIVGLVLAAIAQFGPSATPTAPPPPPPAPAPATGSRDVEASGEGAIAAGGNIGTASTGGHTPPSAPSPLPPPPPSPAPPSGGVTASGKGSIAAGGDIGSASTGN
ncbi:hypothetical protein ACFUN7_07895 [Streptomyces sp. NPDC057236]|uniref:hypothetical protein n=1 Tax=Streptomyces sp. NPDC057236 TaxID=3346059 RepID=UPI00363B5FEF